MSYYLLDMLDWLLWEQNLAFSCIWGQAGFQRGLNDIVEEECAIYKKAEPNNLEPLERLPAQA